MQIIYNLFLYDTLLWCGLHNQWKGCFFCLWSIWIWRSLWSTGRYEWIAVTYTIIYDDENIGTYTANYNGVEYLKLQCNSEELQVDWVDDAYIYQNYIFLRVPKEHDGIVLVMFSSSIVAATYEWYEIEDLYEVSKEKDDAILFCLK